jgi:hypothetical protein
MTAMMISKPSESLFQANLTLTLTLTPDPEPELFSSSLWGMQLRNDG